MTEVVVDIEAVIGQFEKYDDEIRRLKHLYTEAEVKAAAHLNEIERLRATLQAIHKHQKRMPNIDATIWELTRAALGEKE